MLIIKPLLPEDIKSKILKRVEKLVSEASGEVKDVDVWGKRHLAYKIKSHEEGYYVVMQLKLDTKKTKEFERELKLQGDVLRFILVRSENL